MDSTNEPRIIGSPVYADLVCDITTPYLVTLDQSVHFESMIHNKQGAYLYFLESRCTKFV